MHSSKPFFRLLPLLLLLHQAFALEWNAGPGFRSAPLSPASSEKAGFKLLSPESTGIRFTNSLSESRHIPNQILLNGSGVAAGDVDGDGLCDLYFCGLDGPNALYRNLGNWKFEDIAATAGVACPGLDASGVALADIDGDGDLDLAINSVGQGTLLFANDGKGRFSQIGTLNENKGGMTPALADIDSDGDLDLYIANYRVTTIRDKPDLRMRISNDRRPVLLEVEGRPVTDPDEKAWLTFSETGKIIENGQPDALYRNDGKGKFTLIPFTGGAFLDEDGKPLKTPPYDWGLTAMFHDMNGDGAPDLYVCNDFQSPDRIWINKGDGRFQAIAPMALRTTSLFSMGIDFADLNGDGREEFFVADMLSRGHVNRHVQQGDLIPAAPALGPDRPQYLRNTLFLAREDWTYAEIGQFSGIYASEWSWTPIFLDVDLDGHQDLLITTGHERDAMNIDVMNMAEGKKAERQLSVTEKLELNRLFARLDPPNVAFRNRGDMTFEEVSAAWGFNTPGVSHGMALADLDNDGDSDVVMNNLNGAAGIYRNECDKPRLAIRLKGSAPNTRGIGAKIRVLSQSQEVIAGGRYLSSDDPMRVFAAGSLTNEMTIEVVWRSGKKSLVKEAKANRIYEIEETTFGVPPSGGLAGKPPEGGTPNGSAVFEDVSHLLNHTHHEEPFEDFDRQPLLPRKLSHLGPGVAWHDTDGDGWDDLVIGSGRGGRLAVYRNNGNGGFTALTNAPLNRLAGRDQAAVLGMAGMLLVGSANYEDGKTNGGWVRVYDLKRDVAGDSILGPNASTGPLALADVNGDGQLDLFVGGRAVAGRYPEPADSLLMRNDGSKLVQQQRLEKLGLVSGAVWSDLDGDGQVELVLACEWGPVRVFAFEGGKLTERTVKLGLEERTGWWNGVATGDFDGDGRLDIVASNWGLNNRYHAFGDRFQIYYGDLGGLGGVDIIEAYADAESGKVVPFRSLRVASKALPLIGERFPTFLAFGRATAAEVVGDAAVKRMGINTLASTVFLNRGTHFEPRALPMEAQLTPAFGICVGDIDANGTEDLFLSQNFFGLPGDLPRCDAGRGLWLKGDGKGGFISMSGSESGVKVYGEQRGCALSDYDADGKVDLVVTQNGGTTRLFRNAQNKTGLRVRLNGAGGNPAAIGASLRLVYGEKFGPLREIQAGSGYWSQNGSVQIMGLESEPDKVWVRWPGGKVTTSDIPKAAKEIAVDVTGAVKRAR